MDLKIKSLISFASDERRQFVGSVRKIFSERGGVRACLVLHAVGLLFMRPQVIHESRELLGSTWNQHDDSRDLH